ncbi:hypothetical protein M434DRAFT_400852 [Hypoxylon sp. CO27-5]|nr:hypothetical protein M434DRAFT_400852 [Hypoxylon sp. CO27-5]
MSEDVDNESLKTSKYPLSSNDFAVYGMSGQYVSVAYRHPSTSRMASYSLIALSNPHLPV